MFVKRSLDIILSLIALIIACPLIIVISILICFKLGRPILFTQDRVGRNRRVFKIYKFRTMLDKTDSSGNTLPDEERMTAFGRFLRSSSLDELPELINVIKGEMSLVGPRPLLVNYLPLYSERQMTRHSVRPGITGWAQVNGRNSISWNEKFELDIWYVENRSLRLDIKIAAKTAAKVLIREGINQEGKATMDPFNGCN